MCALSRSEENYLKAIFSLAQQKGGISTRKIARELDAKDSSVTDMLKKLAGKGLIDYIKYHGVSLTDEGQQEALSVVRRHRLWEVFLVEKLQFKWDEVHELAEQLEHIQSTALINRLEEFLGFPEKDPHGDPIPDREGHISRLPQSLLSDAELHQALRIVRVKDDSSAFLQYLDSTGISIGSSIQICQKITYDDSLQLHFKNGKEVHISAKVAEQIVVVQDQD